MIVVDASAVLAILLQESDGEAMEAAILREPATVMSPVNLWEVLARVQAAAGAQGVAVAEDLIAALGIAVLPATADDARQATEAFARFGRRTPAGLNLGDCFAYALAKSRGARLLFTGDDFGRTDIERA